MFIIRFLFYSFIAYLVMKMLRVFVTPMAPTKSATPQNPKSGDTAKTYTKSTSTLGEYVEYEEIK